MRLLKGKFRFRRNLLFLLNSNSNSFNFSRNHHIATRYHNTATILFSRDNKKYQQ